MLVLPPDTFNHETKNISCKPTTESSDIVRFLTTLDSCLIKEQSAPPQRRYKGIGITNYNVYRQVEFTNYGHSKERNRSIEVGQYPTKSETHCPPKKAIHISLVLSTKDCNFKENKYPDI